MAVFALVPLLIVGGFVGVVAMFLSADGSARQAHADRSRAVERLAEEHDFTHALVAGDVVVGASEARQSLFYQLCDEAPIWVPFDKIAGIALTPVFECRDEASGTTTVSRGGQLLGAGLGLAVAGPVGALIGGTTASRRTETTIRHQQRLSALELEIRLRDFVRPRLLLCVAQRLPSGSTVPPDLEARARDLAAVLVTVVQDQPMRPSQAIEQADTSIAWPTKPAGSGPSHGWWQRTFGT